jgi:hypothetical protein
MRLIIRVSAVVAVLLASVTMAPAIAFAVPVLSGAYVFSASSNCQAILSVTKDANGKVTGVSIAQGGALNGIAGTIKFTPTTGMASLSGTVVDGNLLLMQGVSGNMTLEQEALLEDWAYSNTGTTVTLNGTVYRVAYGKVVNTIAQDFTLVGREEANRCVFAGTFRHK